jgi:DNA repair exonuclease SbcCD nuclease subunit
MSRLLFYTDAHNSGTSPVNRTDDFPRAVVSKICDAYQIARDRKCDFVVFGGDMFNTHKIFSFDVIGDIMDAIEGSGMQTWAAIGQHDLEGYNPNTYKSSVLAFVEKRSKGIFKTITGEVRVGDVSLWASHVWEKLETAKKLPLDKSRYNILVAHHLLTNKDELNYSIEDTQKFAINSPFDLVLSGDLHDGYEHHKFGSTWFCNPGSLARRSTSDAPRTPRVAVIDFSKNADPVIEYVNVPSGRPGSEVFDFGNALKSLVVGAKSVDLTESEASTKRFTDMVKEFENTSSDIHGIVKQTAVAMGYDKDVIDYLDKKRVELQTKPEKTA